MHGWMTAWETESWRPNSRAWPSSNVGHEPLLVDDIGRAPMTTTLAWAPRQRRSEATQGKRCLRKAAQSAAVPRRLPQRCRHGHEHPRTARGETPTPPPPPPPVSHCAEVCVRSACGIARRASACVASGARASREGARAEGERRPACEQDGIGSGRTAYERKGKMRGAKPQGVRLKRRLSQAPDAGSQVSQTLRRLGKRSFNQQWTTARAMLDRPAQPACCRRMDIPR